MKIADLHCDLLSYLQEQPGRTANDPQSHASIPQLRKGGVVLQTLAIFTITKPGSSKIGEEQFQIFKTLPQKYGTAFSKEIFPLLAIENASGFCADDETIEAGLKRIERWWKEAGTIGYISFTWNDENRFGGGNASKAGMKPDGLSLLRWMDGKNIAIDLSHTSDALAHDILNAIDKYHLKINPIASHSNFRKVMDHPRNLIDEIAKEIIRRKGVLGINFLRMFVGTRGPDDFLLHIEHADKLGGLNHLSFGADFFNEADAPSELDYLKPFFYEGYDNSSCYPKILNLFRKHLSEEQIEKIAFRNLLQFLKPLFEKLRPFNLGQ